MAEALSVLSVNHVPLNKLDQGTAPFAGAAIAAAPTERQANSTGDSKPAETQSSAKSGYYTDKRDGKSYKWVRIGKQVWFMQNLAYKSKQGFYPAEDTSWGSKPSTAVEFIKVYGAFYSWDAARSSCPQGWHLPTRREWEDLINLHGGPNVAGRRTLAITRPGATGTNWPRTILVSRSYLRGEWTCRIEKSNI